MSYRVRYAFPDGRTGHWMRDYATREDAQRAIDERRGDTGLAYAVEEVLEPGSTAAHHVEILRERVKELEAELASLKTSLAASLQGTAKASEAPRGGGDSGSSSFEALEAFLRADTCRSIQAIEDGRFIVLIPGYIGSPASRTLKGISASVEQMVKCESKWLLPISRPKREFGEGTNLWRLEALERWLRGDTQRLVYFASNQLMVALSDSIMDDAAAPTLAALADKLAAKEDKP